MTSSYRIHTDYTVVQPSRATRSQTHSYTQIYTDEQGYTYTDAYIHTDIHKYIIYHRHSSSPWPQPLPSTRDDKTLTLMLVK